MVLMMLLLFLASCLHHPERRSGPRFRDIDGEAPVLKLHLASGEVYVLSKWQLSDPGTIRGAGQKWSAARRLLAEGDHVVPLGEVKVFETNTKRPSSGTNFMLGTLTAATVAFVVALVYAVVEVTQE
jgi:hypothetical protein